MIHHLIRLLYSGEARRFQKALVHPEKTQREVLKKILLQTAATSHGQTLGIKDDDNYQTFIQKCAVTVYEDWKETIESQKESGTLTLSPAVIRYEPTSGSLSKRKWIPYSPLFLQEINRAAQTWVHDLYRNFPKIRAGMHFWSLSWIPAELRGMIQTDDSELFPAYQRFFLNRFIARHPAIQFAPTAESAWWATKVYLASLHDLSFISIWSPSYLLSAIEELFLARDQVAEVFESRSWVQFQKELKRFEVPKRDVREFKRVQSSQTLEEFAQLLWPKLSLVSCWDSASSHELANDLRAVLARSVSIQSKGLWATEGVITFPWRGTHPLSVRSHFYEFRCLQTGDIFPSWELKLGQELQPIVTAGNGILRYALPDRVFVKGFAEKTPLLDFVGRIGSIDLVGEKLSFADADLILAELRAEFKNIHFYCLTAGFVQKHGQYQVLIIGDPLQAQAIAKRCEEKLILFHHYSVARELNQMHQAGCKIFKNHGELSHYVEKSQVKGQNKLNSIMRINS